MQSLYTYCDEWVATPNSVSWVCYAIPKIIKGVFVLDGH